MVSRDKRQVGLLQEWLIRLIEEVPLRSYAIGFVVTIILFAAGYCILTMFEQGIASGGQPLMSISLWHSIYFSVVTISSLGYSDYYPIGLARYLASIEVLIGFVVMGIMIAKLTSFRLSHHVSRIYLRDVQQTLERVTRQLTSSEQDIKSIVEIFAMAYIPVPVGQPRPIAQRKEAKDKFTQKLSTLRSQCMELQEFVEEENVKGAVLVKTPPAVIRRIARALDDNSYALNQLIIALPPVARMEVFDTDNRKMFLEFVSSLEMLVACVMGSAKDKDVIHDFECLSRQIGLIPKNLFEIPVIVAERERPDQILTVTTEPAQAPENDVGH